MQRSLRVAWLLLVACPAPTASQPAAAPATPTERPAEPVLAAGDDWLLWFARDGSWTTRWVRVDGEATQTITERKALLVGAGATIWRVERRDAELEVLGCDCAELDDPAACKARAKLKTLGLQATELGGGAVTTIRAPQSGTSYGESFAEQGVAIVGGADGRLLVEWSDDAFTCGAHPNYERAVEVFDLAAGKASEEAFKDWPARLPEPVRAPAEKQIKEHIAGCDPEFDTFSPPALIEVGVALRGGAPEVHWTFGSEVTYACDSRYMAAGETRSPLVPEAAPIGLAPLPAGVAKALAEIGDAEAVGWSKLAVAPADRMATIARFSVAPEGPWPPATSSLEVTRTPAQEQLDAARALTKAGKYKEAIAAFDAALAIDGEVATAYSGRGYARLLAGELAEARKDFDAALAKDKKPAFQAAVQFNLGQVAERLGDRAAARAAYERSLELRPNKTVQAALTALGAR